MEFAAKSHPERMGVICKIEKQKKDRYSNTGNVCEAVSIFFIRCRTCEGRSVNGLLHKLLIFYKHLSNPILAVSAEFFLGLFIQLIRVNRFAVF